MAGLLRLKMENKEYEDWLDSLPLEACYVNEDDWHEEMSCAKEEDDTPGQDRAGEEGEDS